MQQAPAVLALAVYDTLASQCGPGLPRGRPWPAMGGHDRVTDRAIDRVIDRAIAQVIDGAIDRVIDRAIDR